MMNKKIFYSRIVSILAILGYLLAACSPAVTPAPIASPTSATNLSGIKTYLVNKTAELKTATSTLNAHGAEYYKLAEAVKFDYVKLGADPAVRTLLEEARAAWLKASPLYEQTEGIVAGTPTLADFDVLLDAGASGAEDPEGAAPYDLTLPDGRVLEKPGNLFGVNESTLWGTWPEYKGADVDFDGDGQLEFGESIPDAQVFKAAAEKLDSVTGELITAVQAWTPSESDAFTALVVMVPTMSEYFDSWKNSRFVAGEASTQRDFVAISRLADIQDILSSLQVVHQNVSPLIKNADAAQDEQIGKELADLKAFVADVYAQEQTGKRFSPEEADLLGAEAQNRATAITGKISQVAAKLGIKLEE
jgi:hypothetical protein